MKIEPTGVTTQVTYTFKIEDAEPIAKRHVKSKAVLRPTRAMVTVISDEIAHLTITGPRLRADGTDSDNHATNNYGGYEVDDETPEVVRLLAEAVNEQLIAATRRD